MDTPPLWLPAAPFRSHVRTLMDASGLPWRAIALEARVPPAVVRTLLHGRSGRPRTKIPRQAAENLLRLTEADLHELRRQPGSYDLLRRLMLRLCSRGFSALDVAMLLRLHPERVRSVLTGRRQSTDAYTTLLARAACDALCPDDGEDAYDLPEPWAA